MRIKRSKEFITLPPLAQRIWRRSAQLSSKYFLPLFPRKNARNKKLLSDIHTPIPFFLEKLSSRFLSLSCPNDSSRIPLLPSIILSPETEFVQFILLHPGG